MKKAMRDNDYTVQKERLLYQGNVLITTEGFISDCLTSDDIVLLIEGSNTNNSRNIYCYDLNGMLKWQIAPSEQLHFSNYYTSIYFSEHSFLQAYNINGIEVTINKIDGSIIKKELIK
jgi:hypothetical protein